MARTLGPITALLLGVAFLLAGTGLQFTLLPLRATEEGFSTLAIGLMGSSYFVGFVGGCLFSPYLILRAGHIRAFAAMVAVATAAVLCHAIAIEPSTWAALRVLTGFCLAGLYLVIESWLNDRASNDNRGLVMSAYIVVNYGAVTTGQMLVTLYPRAGFEPFALAAILLALAIVPVVLTRSAQPAPITFVRFRPLHLYRAAPVALVGSFMIGMANGAFWGVGVVFALGSGLDATLAATFASVVVAAGALAQWPIGRMSDQVDRRVLLAMLLGGSIAAGLALGLLPATPTSLLVLGFAFGTLALPGYSLVAAHAYDKMPAGEAVETAAGVLLAYGAGSILGPALASLTMAGVGPGGLFLFTAAAQGLLLAFVMHRARVQPPLPASAKTGFDLAATAPMGAVITTEPLDVTDPLVAVPDTAPAPQPDADPAPRQQDEPTR
jgi:MFS family permease